ncbi:hypothetical protein JCM33374_g761 [Metschnikowia sp. JCM 33374]|nr:hypothetical protein JCM33374_g761 [Metschnikowia sp. JCM 33374]
MADSQSGLYTYLTPHVLADFSGFGTQTLLEALQTPEISVSEASEISSQVFTEILMLVSANVLAVDTVAEFMQSAITDERKAIVLCQVFDVFPPDMAVTELVKRLHKSAGVLQASTLAQYVDSETLVRLDIVAAQSLTRQMNTRKRDEFFTQKKFNLLHEEYEGYSILISEFNTFLNNDESEFLVDHAVHVVYHLIGHYLLDPNRVLDVIIDVCSNYVVGNHRFIIEFFKKSPWWPQVEADCKSGLYSLNVGGNPAVVSVIALRLLKQAPEREISETFKVLVTLFIKEGFISFGQLYPYFSPSDVDMKNLEAAYEKELEEKVLRSSASALALAAPLAEEENEDGATESRPAKPEHTKKTVEALIGFNMRFQMLKCFLGNGLYWPSVYILSQYPFLANIDSDMSVLMHRALAAIIDPLHSKSTSFTPSQLMAFQEEKLLTISQSYNKVRLDEIPVTRLYCFKPTVKLTGSKEFVYFITEWADGLPVLQSAGDLITMSGQFLKFFGPILATNHANFIKLCEIIVADLKADSSDAQKEKWFTYFRNYILPSIGFISENAIPVDKAYEVLSFFSADDRFNLYGELYQVMAKTNPHVKIANGKAEKATKDVLKRLSKENVAPMMRRLAKISLSNPLPCFLTILQQLESYDNLNTLIVETAAYFNEYGWDNLTLAIMMRLTSTGRSNKQANGLNERQWLQSLSSFIGKLCQKYPNSVDLNTLLRYLLSSLHSSGNADLIVLKEMLSSMGGIQAITNLTQLQIDMLNCEPSLQKIVYKTIGDKRYEFRQSGSKLRQALTKNKNINEFLVLLCKINRELIDATDITHLKVLTSIKDEVDSVLHLLCSLVGFFGNDTSNLLQIDEMIKDYDVPIVWAFEFWRNFLMGVETDDLQSQIKSALPEGYFGQISSNFFVLFWKLKLYDLNFSGDLYENELTKLKSRISSLKEQYAFARRDKNTPKSVANSLKDSISETEALTVTIPSEKERHEKHCNLMDEHLIATLNEDLGSFSAHQAKAFLHLCVLPRAVHSSFDAIYSAEFIFKLHKLSLSGYSLMITLDVLFRNHIFFATLFTCSPTEAENLGIFVSAILKELNTWTSEDAFLKNTSKKSLYKDSDADVMTFGEFRENIFEYHTILLEDVSRALEVTTYMSRMNAITYLKNLLGVYPMVEDHCESVIELIHNITKREKRDDLKLSSSALIGHVKSRKNSWVHLWDFIDMEEDAKAQQIEKRKEIEDREKKRLKQAEDIKSEHQRLEEEKWRKEEQEKQAVKDSESQVSEAGLKKQASVPAISYDDGAKASSRMASRAVDAPKGRYDSYSRSVSVPVTQTEKHSEQAVSTTHNITSEKDLVKDHIRTPPAGPNGSNSRLSTPEAPPKSAEKPSRDASSNDLFQRKVDQKEPKDNESPVVNRGQLKSRLDSVRKEFSSKKEEGNRQVSDLKNGRGQASSANTSRSTTPAVPVQAPKAPSSSSSRDSAANQKTGNRVPLPPQVPPRDRFSDSYSSNKGRAPLPPQSSVRASAPPPPQPAGRSRVPLPPQHPPRDRVPQHPTRDGPPQNNSRDRLQQNHPRDRTPQNHPRDRTPQNHPRDRTPQYPSRDIAPQNSSRDRASQHPTRENIPQNAPRGREPQHTSREPQPVSQSNSRGYRGSTGTEERDSNNRHNGQTRRSSGNPLPPPSLPPPARKEFNKEGDYRDRKRRYDDRGRNSDKRSRY